MEDVYEMNFLWSKINNIEETATFLGEGSVGVGHGNAMSFKSLADGTESFYEPIRKSGGISCLAGHSTLPVMAYAELYEHPEIIVCSLPNVTMMEKLKRKVDCQYKQLAFSETEQLVALVEIELISEIEVWNWRTRQLLATHHTEFYTYSHFIVCNRVMPLSLIQVDQHFDYFVFWEVHLAVQKAYFMMRENTYPEECVKPVDIIYSNEGYQLLMCDCNGTVWLINPVTKKCSQIISSEGSLHEFTMIASYKNQIVLSDSSGIIRFYKGSGGDWEKVHSLSLDYEVGFLKTHYRSMSLIGFSMNGALLKYNDDSKMFVEIAKYGCRITFVAVINPLGINMVAINEVFEMYLYEIKTNKTISFMQLHKVKSILEHPFLQIIATGYEDGNITLILVDEYGHFSKLSQINLCEHSIDILKFSESGKVLMAVDANKGIFLIKYSSERQDMSIVNRVDFGADLIDVVVDDVENDDDDYDFESVDEENEDAVELSTSRIYVLGLIKASPSSPCYIIRAIISLSLTGQSINIAPITQRFLTPDEYTSITHHIEIPKKIIASKRNDMNLYLLVLDDTQCRTIEVGGEETEEEEEEYEEETIASSEIKEEEKAKKIKIKVCNAVVEATIPTGHTLGNIQISRSNKNIFLTWSGDTIVQFYDSVNLECLGTVSALTFQTDGIVVTKCDLFLAYIITIGITGNVSCHETTSVIPHRMPNLSLSVTEPQHILAAFRKSFMPDEDDNWNNWVDYQQIKKFEREEQENAEQRALILREVEKINEQVIKLVDENEEVSDEKKLTLSELNPFVKWLQMGESDITMNEMIELENIKLDTEETRQRVEKVIETYWNQMDVRSVQLKAISSKLAVENFALLNEDPSDEANFQKILFWRNLENFVGKADKFQPWMPQPIEDLQAILEQKPHYCESAILRRSLMAFKGQSGTNTALSDFLSGTSSYKYIDPVPERYNQLETVTFQQAAIDNIMADKDIKSLRKYFNKNFTQLVSTKSIQLDGITKSNDRLRKIQDELNILEELKGSDTVHCLDITDHKFDSTETTDNILTVEDWEIEEKRYQSPEELRLIAERLAEAERHRLALLADDFRDRALMEMMNGVLEVLWEDEIKKEIPLPECMKSGKDPKDYDENDMQAVQDYEERVIQLKADREKYAGMLEAEKNKIQESIDDQIYRFNAKVEELAGKKMDVERAILEERFKSLRQIAHNKKRLLLEEKEIKQSKDINTQKQILNELIKTQEELEEAAENLRNKYETLLTKDRLLDKQFKVTFCENQSLQDQGYRIFKRRPKWHIRAWETSAILKDMARRIAQSQYDSVKLPLPQLCMDYLRLIDNAENYSLAPSTIDQNLWQNLCRLKRGKLEHEFKSMACAAQLVETEAAANAYQKEILSMKQKISTMEKNLEEIRHERTEHLMNRSIQLVLPLNRIEVPLTGQLSDFDNCTLVDVKEIEAINNVIKELGDIKLEAMQHAMDYHRKVRCKEWEHKRLTMTVANIKSDIEYIENYKITKEVQDWLKRRERNWRDEDTSDEALEQTMQTAVDSWEAGLREVTTKIDVVEKEIQKTKRHNKRLDEEIQRVNLNLSELSLSHDVELDEKEQVMRRERVAMVAERARLGREVQSQHAKIMELTAVLELEKLRTYPTLNDVPEVTIKKEKTIMPKS